MNDIPTIAANLHTQDNRITASPIFLVQQKRRIYGFEEGYTFDSVWVSIDDGDEVDEAVGRALDEADNLGHETFSDPDEPDWKRPLDNYRRTWYRDEWVFVQPFFTEHGAQEYIRINGHNLREPRIYVESGYRNREWELVREHLMGLRGEGWKS